MFKIVKFLESEEVEIASSVWLKQDVDGEICFWPQKYKSQRIMKAILQAELPDANTWTAYKVSTLGTYDTYERARSKLSRAEQTSNLESDVPPEGTKKRRRYKKVTSLYQSSDSEEDDESINGCKRRTTSTLPMPPPVNVESSNLPEFVNVELGTPNGSFGMNSQQVLCSAENPIRNTPTSCAECSHNRSSTHWSRFNNATSSDKQIFRMLDGIKQTLKEHTTVLNNIVNLCSRNYSPAKQNVTVTDFPNLPVTSLNEMDEFENFLSSPSNFQQAIQHLLLKGGDDIGDTARRIMTAIFTYEVASEINWAGRGMKKSFKNMRIKTLVLYTVQQNKVLKDTNEKEIEKHIKLWLKYAPLRLKYRMDKLQRQQLDIE